MTELFLQNKRNPYWDNIKGILISLVILGHFLWNYWGLGLAGSIVGIIYSFHMPAFIFASGFMSKSDHSRSKQSIINLGVIYIIFNTTLMIFSFALFDTPFNLITPYYSSWFLISLIVWRMTIKHTSKVKHVLIISIIIAFLIGMWRDISNVLAISRTVVFFPFFIMGYNLSGNKLIKFINERKPLDYFKGLLLLLTSICMSQLYLYQYSDQSYFLMDNYNDFLGFFARIAIFGIAALMIISIVILTPKKPLPLLRQWGRNSLAIYVLHRFITLLYFIVFPAGKYNEYYIIFALCATAITLLILGSDMVSRSFKWLINKITLSLSFKTNQQKECEENRLSYTSIVVMIIILLLPILSSNIFSKSMPVITSNPTADVHEVMNGKHEAALKDAVSIAFVGDLILLQDQVRNAYSEKSGEHEFGSMFDYAKEYLSEADLAIGILEGPTAGEELGYSTSNYDDGLPLYLNYPDSFAQAVKDSGIDLVSTANNHLMDKGEDGALRTLDILDEVGLSHVGSYRNAEEKNTTLILEQNDIRIAILAYTFGSNGYTEEYFLHENPSLTSILVEPTSKHFEEVKAEVQSDIKMAKDMQNPPDLIVIIPHMGSQFLHQTDTYQDTWNNIFINAGADIVLGDHSHSVQPIEFRKTTNGGEEKRTIIVNCPGNFANSYVEKDGDATSIVEIYLDPQKKEIICAGIIPMYTHSPSNGNYRALPIYTILNDPVLQKQISRYEMKRVAEIQAIVSSVMLGTKLTLDQAQERYYLFPEGYVRQHVKALEITAEMSETKLYKLLSKSKSVCFVGDSITAGSVNGGYGWYEPLIEAFPDQIVYKEAWGSATTLTLLENSETIAGHGADLYVIAIGTNDVRYRDEQICAMTSYQYISNINMLVSKILEKNNSANFVLISPWLALDNDPNTKLSTEQRDLMLEEFSKELRLYCDNKGYCFINPNSAIEEKLHKYAPSNYLLDYIHPNANAGITLYSKEVFTYGEEE